MTQAIIPSLTERQLQHNIIAVARECGWLVHHQTVALYSAAGMPDLCLCRPPRLIFAELKGPKGKVTPKQQEWLDTLRQVPGIEVYLWREGDLEAIYKTLIP